MKMTTRFLSVILAVILMTAVFVPFTSSAASQVYYKIDMSASVLKSRIQQQVSSDCAVVSMATIESYLYGATSTADKNTVYKALVSKNKDDNYAYWSNCGYLTKDINWTDVYNQLAKGYPVIVHRPAASGKVEHWAVVAGYNGSTTTLEKDKFIIVDVYHGSGGTDIYTSKSWRGSTTIDRMAYRKNGIAITSLSGIRFAIDHPVLVHQKGSGHGVYGYITADTNLTSIHFTVTNIKTGSTVFNKTVTPNAKSYLIYNLDSEFTFAKWPVGEYYFTVIAKTASSQKVYNKYFQIASGWPSTAPVLNHTFAFDSNGGNESIASQTVAHNGKISIPTDVLTRDDGTFLGWTVVRKTDGKSYCVEGDWYTEAQIMESGYNRKIYKPGESYNYGYEWFKGCLTNLEYTFIALWDINVTLTTDSITETGSTVSVDTDRIAELDPTFANAVAAGDVAYQWYRNDDPISGATSESLLLTDEDAGCSIYVSILYADVTITGEPFVVTAAEKIIKGDANGDEKINLSDVSLLLKYVALWDVEINTEAADVTGDGKVNLNDVSLILKYIALWDVTLG